jgi:hypothetical protein
VRAADGRLMHFKWSQLLLQFCTLENRKELRMHASSHRRFWILAMMVFIAFPDLAAGVGEYDGMWAGEEKVYVEEDPPETGYAVIIIFQPNQNELYVSDDIVGSIRLVRSGGRWVLPAPIETTYLGLDAIVDSMTVSFSSTNQLSGEIRLRVDTGSGWIDARGTFVCTKQTCLSLSSGVPIRNLSGTFGNDHCFQIDVPQGASELSVRTSGGAGNADIMIFYSRPDFKTETSDDPGNNENVTIPVPQAGRWYIYLYTCDESYSGLTLIAGYEATPSPLAAFSAAPTAGKAPLSVQFSDRSTGDVNTWSWNFGDGATSTQPNPTHTYREPGAYTVELIVSGPGGSDTETKTDLIVVEPTKTAPWLPLLLDE